MKKLFFILIISLLSPSFSYSQKKNEDVTKIKKTIIGFLIWYKANGDKLYNSPITTGFNPDTVKSGHIVNINMNAVDEYLINFKRANYVSDVFLTGLREIYRNVSDTLIKHPLIDYYGPIGGLEADLIFGFEPEEILDHIKEGRFTKIRVIYDKAIVKFDITHINQYIFTLTKVDNKWLIDYFGLDRTNFERMLKSPTKY